MLPGFVQGGRRAVAGDDPLSAAGAHVSLLPLRAPEMTRCPARGGGVAGTLMRARGRERRRDLGGGGPVGTYGSTRCR